MGVGVGVFDVPPPPPVDVVGGGVDDGGGVVTVDVVVDDVEVVEVLSVELLLLYPMIYSLYSKIISVMAPNIYKPPPAV